MPFHRVRDFQEEVIKLDKPERGMLDAAQLELAKNQMIEEVDEFITAHEHHDYIGAIDAMTDLMYFAIGNLHKLGLSPVEMEKIFAEVHNCNMTKKRGVVERRGDGSAPDAIKPEGWVGPEIRIAMVLEGQI